jgi:hypothetical protein
MVGAGTVLALVAVTWLFLLIGALLPDRAMLAGVIACGPLASWR